MAVFFIVFIGLAISSGAGPAVRNLASISNDRNWTEATDSHGRFKRQTQCGLYEWQCADGTCIPIDGECNGKVDCPDKSDETHARCKNKKCHPNAFRCTYGACVDGNAPCNKVMECADLSDELLTRCRNETRQIDQFRCLDEELIPTEFSCDGIVDCLDGSDETVRGCADRTCPEHLYQCAYGACVDQGAECNGINECADSSDEDPELCNPPNRPVVSEKCVLPPYPEHGTYTTGSNTPQAKPGQALPYVQLNVSCDEGYGVVGDSVVFCQDGKFSTKTGLPQCVPFCKLDPHISVHYQCKLSRQCNGRRPCNSAEPVGTVVIPECNFPNYFSHDLRYMRCGSDGQWNRIVRCRPECGRITPTGDGLVINGTTAKRGEVPWHVAVYRKPTRDYKQYELICGGSLVSNSVVISAGHCFWDVGMPLAASLYSVATAKLFNDWDHPDDKDAQKSELLSIELPDHFRGSSANFQSDLAVLILETPFKYHTYVRPVCLSLSLRSDAIDPQLETGALGKVAGFGLTEENGQHSPVLKVVDLPYVPVNECYRVTPLTFTENITGDKICAGYSNGTAALCKGDSGGGLVFPETDLSIARYYLRGVVSTAPTGPNKCNRYTVITFTQIKKHEDFINQFL
ncbi:hypothetical protein PYW08_012613 [Mythimna loreyi]|uniref:Uncharacterized protein n=2 Tax=Mythimna loreyi TaxID=667449 RepID=A0ACC2Q3G0_9NEOP|nr:hypothetical protein PYW08_012600 [Mythimna loreyi]KAJ8705567.1 hypothetical protein PYW08_012613 [Mythimna loreyi]